MRFSLSEVALSSLGRAGFPAMPGILTQAGVQARAKSALDDCLGA